MDKYTSNPNNTGGQEDFIMLRIGQVENNYPVNDNSLQRNVLKFEVVGVGQVATNTQALFWVPFFSSAGCNEAIMSTTGQGCRYSQSSELNQENGDLQFDTQNSFVRYDRSIINSGCGSLNPTLSFSDVNSRFQFSDLYSPITSSNYYNYTGSQSQPQPANVGNEIISYNNNYAYTNKITTGYGINILSFPIQTPIHDNFIPFNTQFGKFHILCGFNKVFPWNVREKIGNLESNSIVSPYYQESGVYIEKWVEKKPAFTTLKGDWNDKENYFILDVVFYKGVYYEHIALISIAPSPIPGTNNNVWRAITYILETEDNFNLSLWRLLGFSWDQSHNQIYQENEKVSGLGDRINRNFYRNGITINENGIIGNQKHYSIPITNNTNLFNPQFNNLLFQNAFNFNNLQIVSETTKFLAENLPIRSEDPFFCIVSSILNDGGIAENYYSQNSILSVVDVVEKSVNSSDFFTYSGNLIHEISRAYDIGEVEHEIRKANGRLLNTNEFSSVIYLANINMTIGLNPQLLQFYENENKMIEEKKEEKDKLIQKLETKDKLTKKQEILKKILTMNEMVNQEYEVGLNIEELL